MAQDYQSCMRPGGFLPPYAELLPSLWSYGLGRIVLLLLDQILLIEAALCACYGLKWKREVQAARITEMKWNV